MIHASIIGGIGITKLTPMQAHAAIAAPGTGEKVSFRESLQAAQAVEKPAQAMPEAPARAARVGISPPAKMRTPDASSPDNVAATYAEKAVSKTSQDAGAVVVTKDATRDKNTSKAPSSADDAEGAQPAIETAVDRQTADQPPVLLLPGNAAVNSKMANGTGLKNTAVNGADQAADHGNTQSDVSRAIAVEVTNSPQMNSHQDRQAPIAVPGPTIVQTPMVAATMDQLPAVPLPGVRRMDAPVAWSANVAGAKGSNNLIFSGPAKAAPGDSRTSDVAKPVAVADDPRGTKDSTVVQTADRPSTMRLPGLQMMDTPAASFVVSAGTKAANSLVVNAPAKALPGESRKSEVAGFGPVAVVPQGFEASPIVARTLNPSQTVPLPSLHLMHPPAVPSGKSAGTKDANELPVNGPVKIADGDIRKSDPAALGAVAVTDDAQDVQAPAFVQAMALPPALPLPGSLPMDAPAGASVESAGTKGLKSLAVAVPSRGNDRDTRKSDVAPANAGTTAKIESDVRSLPVTPVVAPPIVHEAANGLSNAVSSVTAAPVPHGHASPETGSKVVAPPSAPLGNPAHAATGQAEVATLVATPNVLEIGVASGSHGWLRVRAEMGQMGQVTASVAAASSGATEGLHKELPAIAAYLASERVDVSGLSVSATAKVAGTQDAAMSFGNGTNQRGGNPSGAAEKMPAKVEGGWPEMAPESGWQGLQMPAVTNSNGSGSWLSVRV